MKSKMSYVEVFSILCLSGSVVSILSQFFSNNISIFISPLCICGVMVLFLQSKKEIKNLKLIFITSTLLTFNLFYSIVVNGNEVGAGLRFYMILILIQLTITIKINKVFMSIFLRILLLFTFFLIFTELYYVTHPNQWIIDRQEWRLNGIGDVYSFNGWFYKIQIKGNSLVPIAYFLSYYHFTEKKKKLFYIGIFLIGTLIAGNTMYIVAIVVFHFLRFVMKLNYAKVRIKLYQVFLLLIGLIVFYFIAKNLVSAFEMKSDSSWPIRVDQVKVLLEDMSRSVNTLLFGNGLGSTLENPISLYRNYAGATYFELQSIYIFNQLGIVNFVLYLSLTIELIKRNWIKKEVIIILLAYVSYSISNPYIFDITNIIIFILLSCLQEKLTEEDNLFVH